MASRVRLWKRINVILNLRGLIEQISDLLRLILVSEVLVSCVYDRLVQRGILSMYILKMMLHLLLPVNMSVWVNVELSCKIGIYNVQGFVEGERHNPVGVARTIFRTLEIGERKLSYTLFVLVYALGRHIGNSLLPSCRR